MKPKQNLTLVFLTLFSFVLICGCADDVSTTPPSSSKIIVNGKVINIFGHPLAGKKVIINDKTMITGSSGEFSINDVKPPYDVIVLDSPSVFVVKNLISERPLIPGQNSVDLNPAFRITIPSDAFYNTVVVFSDTSGYNFGSILIPRSQTTAVINTTSQNGELINGTVYILKYDPGFSTSHPFICFAKKSLSFTMGSPANIAFESNELTYNPPNKYTGGSVQTPPGSIGLNADLYINFGRHNNYYNHGCYIRAESFSGGNFSFLVPDSMDALANLNLLIRTYSPGTEKFVKLTAGSTQQQFTIDTVPSLLYPADGFSNADTSTAFSYGKGGGDGVHFFVISSSLSNRYYYIYTNTTEFRIPNLSAYGQLIGSNTTYSWGDIKLSGSGDINSFCTAPSIILNIDELLRSQVRSFTTRP